jgi:hypothetical protein
MLHTGSVSADDLDILLEQLKALNNAEIAENLYKENERLKQP